MHDLVYENQERLIVPLYTELTRVLELSPATIRRSLEDQVYRSRVRADFNGGVRSGVKGTPTFFINGRRHDGPFDFEDLARAINEVIGTARGAAKG
jgi:protein-disulfide isomerase